MNLWYILKDGYDEQIGLTVMGLTEPPKGKMLSQVFHPIPRWFRAANCPK